MFDSKALKDFPEEKESSKLYRWWISTKLSDYCYDFTWKFIEKPIHKVKLMWDWYFNVFRYDVDFDAHSIFAILEYKLKRVEKVLIDGRAYQEPEYMKALKLAIKLAGRLSKDNYSESFHDRHDRKWGKTKSWFTDSKTHKGLHEWHSSRPKANAPEEKEQESKDFMAMAYAIDAKTNRERKWFFNILNKYIPIWWD